MKEPSDKSWHSLCSTLGVLLTWPNAFANLIQTTSAEPIPAPSLRNPPCHRVLAVQTVLPRCGSCWTEWMSDSRASRSKTQRWQPCASWGTGRISGRASSLVALIYNLSSIAFLTRRSNSWSEHTLTIHSRSKRWLWQGGPQVPEVRQVFGVALRMSSASFCSRRTPPPKRPDTWEADRRRRGRSTLRDNSRSPASRCTRWRSRTPIVHRCWSGAHSRSSPPGRSTQKVAHHNRGNSQRSGDTNRGAGCRTGYCRQQGRRMPPERAAGTDSRTG